LDVSLGPDKTASKRRPHAGFVDGETVMMIASRKADIERVKQMKDDTRLLGISEELARTARRAQRQTTTPVPPSGEYTFKEYRALPISEIPGASPGSGEALKLLHRLAADPGIVAVMGQHRCDFVQHKIP
jgi:hypothetical protein